MGATGTGLTNGFGLLHFGVEHLGGGGGGGGGRMHVGVEHPVGIIGTGIGTVGGMYGIPPPIMWP